MPSGSKELIEFLQSSLRMHWAAIETYTLQSDHYAVWGYPKLAEKYKADAKEERGHAKKVIQRLEFFDVTPEVEHDPVEWPRHDFVGSLDANYGLETSAATLERDAYAAAIAAGDAGTAEVFAFLLAASEDSIIEIEALREVIGTIGLDNYLANQT